jgi:glucokinase
VDKLWLGIDLGGTNTKLGLAGREGLVARRRFPTRQEDGPANWLERLAGEVEELCRRAGAEPPAGAGVASPGVIQRPEGVVLSSPNLPAMDGFPLAAEAGRALGLAAVVENDANCYALGEHSFGVGRGRDLACFTRGTGVGGGLIIGGRLVVGPLGTGGELGHGLAEPGGRTCGCGAPGCVEAYASATGLKGLLAEALAQGAQTGMAPGAEAEDMARAAREGDELARRLFDMAGRALGRAFADVAVFSGLDLIVLGGGLSAGWPLMEPAALAEMGERLRITDPAGVRIVTSELGDDAPVLGAAALARQQSEQRNEGGPHGQEG